MRLQRTRSQLEQEGAVHSLVRYVFGFNVFRVEVEGVRVYGFRAEVLGLRSRVLVLAWFGIYGFRVKVSGLEFRVCGHENQTCGALRARFFKRSWPYW